MKWKAALIASAFIWSCDQHAPEPHFEDEWGADLPYRFEQQPAPQCPAPGSDHAASYQQHGGADNAMLWWMMINALDDGHPQYQQPHYQPYQARPRVGAVVHLHYDVETRVRPVAPQQARPASGLLRAAPIYKAPPPPPKPAVVKSQSYGFKASARMPSSTGFRPSAPVKIKTSTRR
jgi:hypothetical protein